VICLLTAIGVKPGVPGNHLGERCHYSVSKVHPETFHERPEGEQTYCSTLSLTSALDGGGRSMIYLGRFTPQ